MPNKLNFLVILLLLCSCASEIRLNRQKVIEEVHLSKEIRTDFSVEKALYNKLEDITYIKEKNSDLIHIFKGNKKLNTIGGFGSGEYNFNKISDIALAPDGFLLILDSFQKKLKKFDSSGKFITEFYLENMVKPLLFDISLDETFFIYDAGRKEIVVSNFTNEAEPLNFGKFLLEEPVSLLVNRGFVQIYEKDLNKTLFFNLWGDLIQEIDGYILSEQGNLFLLEEHTLTNLTDKKQLAVNVAEWQGFSLKYGFLVINSRNSVKIFEIEYEI